MNANRLINMVFRMVMRKGLNLTARRMFDQRGAGAKVGNAETDPARHAAKLARQAKRLNRRL